VSNTEILYNLKCLNSQQRTHSAGESDWTLCGTVKVLCQADLALEVAKLNEAANMHRHFMKNCSHLHFVIEAECEICDVVCNFNLMVRNWHEPVLYHNKPYPGKETLFYLTTVAGLFPDEWTENTMPTATLLLVGPSVADRCLVNCQIKRVTPVLHVLGSGTGLTTQSW
jgi:hypothetical protein